LLALGPVPGMRAQAPNRADPVAKLSCAQAYGLLLAQAMRTPPDVAFLKPTRHNDADASLRELTYLGLGPPRCAAAFGVRGLLKWFLATTDWVPKDAPGQRPGVPWNLDAIYDMALAGQTGGEGGSIAATVATELLLPKPALPFLVREVGPSLLSALAIPTTLPDTVRQFERGMLASWLWSPEIADSAFSSYAAAGGAAGRAALELARVRLALHMASADTLYYQAAGSSDSAVIAGLREDLGWIADSAELAGFDSTTNASRPAWLRTFWESRDLEALRRRGDRLAEHYRRIGFAKAHFRLLSLDRKYELNELWVNRDAPFDDRGLLYIRHGQPDDTASAVRAGACPNVSWRYRRPDGNLVFHFVARENPDDWRLVETLANVSGEAGATTRVRRAGSDRSCAVIDDLLESRATLDPIYARLVTSPSRQNWERELALTTRSRKVGTTTDSDPLRFPTMLGATWRSYALLGESPGTGRVLTIASVPADQLEPIISNPPGYGFRLHLVARSADTVIEIDSTRRFRSDAPLEPGQMLTFLTEVPLHPGTWKFGSVLRQPVDSAGQYYRTPTLIVPDAGASATLQMSDIVLGTRQGGQEWSAPDGAFMLSPTGAYRHGEPVLTYYELAGLRAGDTLHTDVVFAREGSHDRVTLSFTEAAGVGILRVRREMATDRLKEGTYTLTVTVRGAGSDRTVTRSSTIYIVKDSA
jgi:GWxTD domain-containing protein